MTDEELERLQGLCNAATDGPWVAGVRKQAAASYSETHAAVIGPEYVYADRDKNFCEPDGIFIAESREAVPALIAEVRRLKAREKFLSDAWSSFSEEYMQKIGKLLGCPWFKDDPQNFPDATEADGVCTGDDVLETMIDKLIRENDRLKAIVEDSENTEDRECGWRDCD